MGYSITVEARNKGLKELMLGLMEIEFRHWDEVLGIDIPMVPSHADEGELVPARYITGVTDDVSYPSGRRSLILGFDYGAWGADGYERLYYWSVLRWMALKVGKRKRQFKMDGHELTFVDPQPYTQYDCDGEDGFWPVILKPPRQKRFLWLYCEPLGLQRDPDVLAERLGHEFIMDMRDFHPDKPFGENFTWKAEVVEHLVEGLGTIEQRKQLVRKLCWKELTEALVPIRTELVRLDTLWTELVA